MYLHDVSANARYTYVAAVPLRSKIKGIIVHGVLHTIDHNRNGWNKYSYVQNLVE